MIPTASVWRISSCVMSCRCRNCWLIASDLGDFEPIDVSNAVVYLASDEARYVTGLQMKVDAGLVGR